MELFATIVGALGGLSAVAGILNAADVIPNDLGFMNVDWMFWFLLAGILLLASIAISVGRRFSAD